MSLATLHVARDADDTAGRAASRTHRAALAVGLRSDIIMLGRGNGETIALRSEHAPDPLGDGLGRVITSVTKGAKAPLSFAHPALALDRHPLFNAAEVIHLHGALPGLAPDTVRLWLDAGKRVAWSLHDYWPLTGGCHRPGPCGQWRTGCMSCPLFDDAWSLVPNAFAEKRASFADSRLTGIAPTRWMEARARESAIFGRADIRHLPDSVDTAIFTERADRTALRAGFGFSPADVLILLGDGATPVIEALCRAMAEAPLAPPGARVGLLLLDAGTADIPGVTVLHLGAIAEPAIRADVMAAADLACWPGDGAEDHVLEALACGTPCLVPAGGAAAECAGAGATWPEAASALVIADAIRRAFATGADARTRQAIAAPFREAHSFAAIGLRLAEIYTRGIAPHDGMDADRALTSRVTRALAMAPVARGGSPNPAFLRFPLNHRIAREPETALPRVTLPPPAPRRLLVIRSRHAHHASVSGPAEFLRHLPPDWEAETWTVPLGSDLAPAWSARAAALGRVSGAATFGHNTNSWIAEAEILARCAAAPVDLVHFIDGEHGGAFLPRLRPGLFPPGHRPRFVATFHQPPDYLRRVVSRETLRALDGAIVLCASMHEALAPYVAEDRLFLIPHGIDTEFYTPAPEREADGTLRLLAVGHWLRDYPAALAALATLRARGTDARLTIVWKDFAGTPPPGVTIAHGLSDEALREAYRQADALLLPLTDATANNAILEAMACGRPIVSTDIGGVRETVGEAALLCPPGDAAALAVALTALAADPARRRALGQAARARAETLAWPGIAARQAAIYARVMALGDRMRAA